MTTTLKANLPRHYLSMQQRKVAFEEVERFLSEGFDNEDIAQRLGLRYTQVCSIVAELKSRYCAESRGRLISFLAKKHVEIA